MIWRLYLHDSFNGVWVLGDASAERARAVHLHYSWGPEGRKEHVSYTVLLSWTVCNFGGSRPWCVCPEVVNGVSCG